MVIVATISTSRPNLVLVSKSAQTLHIWELSHWTIGQMSKLLKRKRTIKRESAHAEICDETNHDSAQRNRSVGA